MSDPKDHPTLVKRVQQVEYLQTQDKHDEATEVLLELIEHYPEVLEFRSRVTDLLKVQDVTEVHASGLSEAAKNEIADVIKRHGGDLKSIDNPTATMEDLFLNIVRESEARPGARRVSADASTSESSPASENADSGEGGSQ